MEDGFADEPQELVNACPELAQLNQSSGAACEDVHAVDNVTEAEDQTAGNNCGDQGSEDLCQSGKVLSLTKSKFKEIYRDLKYHVEQGDYLYSELLPSENNLIGIYDCSRNTIRRAIAGLVEDGYVQAVHGKGVQVIFQPLEKTNFTVGGIESFRETAARNRMTYCTKVVVYETITVDESLSRESSFPVGSEVLHICRVRCVDDKPLILDVNYFLKSAVPGLTKEIAENSIYTYLEQELKMQIVTSKRKITVEKATPQDRELIFMDGYNCLAVVTSNTFNSDGVMFEYTQSRHQPEYFSFHDTATRKKTALNK